MQPHRFVLVLLAILTPLAAAEPPGASKPRVSPEEAFRFLDTDGNGTVSEEEFSQLKDYVPFFQTHPEAVAATFKKLDLKGDGQLTFEEYRELYKLGQRAQNGNPTPPAAPAPKPETAKSEPAKPPAPKADQPTADGLAFFEKKIRPVLADKCYKCHAADAEKIKGGLVLDTRQGIRKGGDTGPAVVPGDVPGSLLAEALHYGNKDLQMPPEKAGGKLPDEVIADFEQWIKMGAPDPRDKETQPSVASKPSWDTEKARDHWAFKAPQRQVLPAVKDTTWPKSELDRFVLAQLDAKSITPVADASPRTLARRIYFDLIGLPPTPEEVEAFVRECTGNRDNLTIRQADKQKAPAAAVSLSSPAAEKAIEHLVDRLLASPQFGERWGRHWLDVARYAESTGREVNCTLPQAWRYRDYVISALNGDKPYNEFIREQIAGDLLPAKDNRELAEHQVATGFLAVGSHSLSEKNPRQFALDLADEQIDTVSQAVLGLTVACARCHDHKFDPIPQRDYYAMAGIFLSTDTLFGAAPTFQNARCGSLIELPTDCGLPRLPKTLSPEEREKKNGQLAAARKYGEGVYNSVYLKAANGKMAGGLQGDAKNGIMIDAASVAVRDLEIELNSYEDDGRARLLAMGVRDFPAERPSRPTTRPATIAEVMERYAARPLEFSGIGDSPLFARGDVAKPTDKVPRGFVSILTHGTPPQIPGAESGRKELAEWLVAPDNALTSRVFVNRVWHWIFGRGIVESVDNFGTTGQAPANPALLDYLALRFQEQGWSVKALIRDILLSHTYQLSSTYDEKDFTADPDNSLVWRMSPRRLDAECIRDAMLAVSGALNLEPPIGSAVAMVGDGSIGGYQIRNLRAPLNDEPFINAGGDQRSIYLPVPRAAVPDSLAVFDYAEPSTVTGHRDSTTAPSQALYMLNNTFVGDQARRLAEKLLALPREQRLDRAFLLTFARLPSSSEKASAEHYFDGYPAGDDGGKAAWTNFCRALFGSAEFRMLD